MKINILDVFVDNFNLDKVIEKFSTLLGKDQKSHVFKINAEFLVNAKKDQKFREILNSAELATADGIGVLWAAKFLSLPITDIFLLRQLRAFWQATYTLLSILFYPKYIRTVIPERVGGVKLMLGMVDICTKFNKSIFLLGGLPEAAEKTSKQLLKKFPKLKVAGVNGGMVNNKTTLDIIREINKSKAQVLFVALGSPKQEFWIAQNLFRLKTIKVAIGEGGSFDFIAGKVKRAPKLVQKLGLEWFWRFLMQPQRLGRIVKAVLVFVWNVVKWKMNQGL